MKRYLILMLLLALPAYGQVVPFVFVPSGGGGDISSPDEISGLITWYNTDDTSDGSMRVVTDSLIEDLFDQVAPTTDSVHWTAAKAIIRTKGAKYVAYFPGTQTYAGPAGANGDDGSPKPMTTFAVINHNGGTTYKAMWCSNAIDGLEFRVNNDSTYSLVNTSTAVLGTSSSKLNGGTWYVVSASYSAAGAVAFHKNAIADGTATNDQALAPSGFTLAAHYSGGTERFAGYIAELLIYDSVLSDTDRNKVFTYLNNKWTVY